MRAEQNFRTGGEFRSESREGGVVEEEEEEEEEESRKREKKRLEGKRKGHVCETGAVWYFGCQPQK